MRLEDDDMFFTPTDLSRYFKSPYISWLMHRNLLLPKEKRVQRKEDATQKILAQKGYEFEGSEVKRQKAIKGQLVIEVTRSESVADDAKKTIEAMKKGADIIFQAAFKHEPFEGYADFLIKVPGRKSKLGDYSYEVADTKLSHSPKPEYALQLCCYNEMLANILGDWPTNWHLYLGDGTKQAFPVSDFRYYYAYLKERFLAFHKAFSIKAEPVPEPWEDVTGYEEHVDAIFKAADHLTLVAGVTLNHIKRLNETKINTRLALSKAKDQQRPGKMQPNVFERLREQAQLQIQTEQEGQVAYRVLAHPPGDSFGLARLPKLDEGDVIFDMEGYPLADGGFEYLYGVMTQKMTGEKVTWQFQEWTAKDIGEERKTYEDFMAWLIKRYLKFPQMHIYHYAAYEPSALARLSNKYGTKVSEIDMLLKGGAFVDLYQVVREGIRAGTTSYSIKKIEALYNFKRTSEVTKASDSVVQFHNYLELRHIAPKDAHKILADITRYNEEDVDSTLKLLAWLHKEKKKNKISSAKAESAPPELEDPKEWEVLSRSIAERPPKWIKGDAEDLRVNAVAADLVGYFHREERPVWWAYFSRQNSTQEDLLDDAECLALARVTGRVGNSIKISFDPNQPLKIKEGQKLAVHGEKGNSWNQPTISELDLIEGTATLTGRDFEKGTVFTLIPGGPLKTDSQKNSLDYFGKTWLSAPRERSLNPAVRDLLYRQPPRVKGIKSGASLYSDKTDVREAALSIAQNLQESCLSIQGPPGSGKTYTGGYLIANLLREGKRVAVVAQGKKTIENLLQSAVSWWKKLYPKSALPQILMADNDLGGEGASKDYTYLSNSAAKSKHAKYALVGGTHFLFSQKELATLSFHYLFVDEAGQFSLAATVACANAAKNLVLLGDQMQLEQVNVGQHPGESGLSVLGYLMNGQNTVPRSHGVFLDQTYRMNPAITELVSELVYDGKLRANKCTTDHLLIGDLKKAGLRESGVIFHSVEHSHNSMSSDEEADSIVDIISILKRASVPSASGKPTKFTGKADDLIIITPYNMQVELIRSKLPGVKVGSVDLFQGQEAWVSILSMCASGEEGLYRGLDFLLSKNRLNVGLSRAKALSIIVGSPRLLDIRPRNIKTIPLLNFYAALMRFGVEKAT